MSTFLDPAILFFVFGLLAGGLRSNLEIPPPIARFLSAWPWSCRRSATGCCGAS